MRIRPGILLLLGFVFLVGVFKVLPKGSGGATRAPRSAELLGEETRGGSRGRRTARLMEPPVLRTAELDRPAEGGSMVIGRNLFRYAPPRAPETPAAGPAGPAGRPGRPVGAVPPAPPPSALTPAEPPTASRPSKPQPPPVTVRYLGAFGPEGRMLAIFASGGEIYDVFEGETFADRYILRRIHLETVEIGFVGFPEDQIEKLEVGP